jgi:long-chain fatty acid transport protein
MKQHIKWFGLGACLASSLLSLGTIPATAGSFGLHEHSAYGQGASFAGIAAGGSLSSMFWNPAVMTQFSGVSIEGVVSGFIGEGKNTVNAAGTTLAAIPYSPHDLLDDALIPAMYASWQVRPDLWIGISVNAPFGLSVSFPDFWPGRNYAQGTSLKTYNATPTIAYRVNEWLSVGVGVQIEYATANLWNGLLPIPNNSLYLKGNGWGFGATAGLTITPGPNTMIGLGWRSFIDQQIEGSLALPGFPFVPPFSTPGAVKTTLKLPDIVSLGVRHRFAPQWTVLGTVEWTNWSRIGTSRVLQLNGNPALIGGSAMTLPFQYRDGWFFSGGFEYAWLPTTTLRAGIGYEISPVSDAVRTPRIPDANRIWVSGGLTYAVSNSLKIDLGYSHLFVDKANIAIGPGHPWFNPALPITYSGTARGSIDIISLGVKYQFNPTPAPALIRKG